MSSFLFWHRTNYSALSVAGASSAGAAAAASSACLACDHVGLLHKGGILLSRDLDEMKMNLHKVQCVLKEGMQPEHITGLDILKTERRGKLLTLTVRGSLNQVEFVMQQADPVFYETIPLSLEEIFISETEVVGYDVKKLIF